MSKAWCVVKGLAALILVALLVIGGLAIHRIGWSQGYSVGQLAASGEEGMLVPCGFGPMGILLAFGLLFLLLIVIGKVFRLLAWKRMMAFGPWPMAAHWARHWRHHHRPMPPWCWGWEKPSDEAEPDAETSEEE